MFDMTVEVLPSNIIEIQLSYNGQIVAKFIQCIDTMSLQCPYHVFKGPTLFHIMLQARECVFSLYVQETD